MVDIRPFRGWRYDAEVAGDPASVLSPPYDLITPEMQAALRQLNPYNVVHLEAGEGLDWSAPDQDQYSGTASIFQEWTAKGVLKRDTEACCYLLRQQFQHQGTMWSRLGLTACVGLEEYDSRRVLPHEYTEAPAIRDRVSLMEACSANISPIMSIYRDTEGRLAPIFREVMGNPPVVDVQDSPEHHSTLWRITEHDHLDSIKEFFKDTPVFLADGHHRYEAALEYQRKKNSQATATAHGVQSQGDQAHNYMMMTLISFDDPGLLVMPYHRTLGGLSGAVLAQVQELLFQIFEPMSMASSSAGGAEDLVDQVAARGKDGHALGMVGPEGDGPRLLTLREGVDWRSWGPLAVSEAWILEEKVLKPVLGDTTLAHLGYIHDHEEALALVASRSRQIAFLLKPFPMDQFEAIVGRGQRLPRKSTFFYPKLPTGLVINQLDGTL